jgi:hypothetical protein
VAGAELGAGSVEGVGHALVGGVGLPVGAVGADLEQDGNAVPGGGDLCRGHPAHELASLASPEPASRRQVLAAGALAAPAICLGGTGSPT